MGLVTERGRATKASVLLEASNRTSDFQHRLFFISFTNSLVLTFISSLLVTNEFY